MNDSAKAIRAKFLETEDHYRAGWERNPHKPRYWLIMLVVLPMAAAVLLPEALKNYRNGDSKWWVGHASIPVVGLLAWLFLICPSAQWRLIRKSLRKQLPNPPTEAWLEFSDAGFLAAGKNGQSSFHPWNSVPIAVEFNDGVIFYFDENHQSHSWIPKAAFSSASEYEQAIAPGRSKVAKWTKCNQ